MQQTSFSISRRAQWLEQVRAYRESVASFQQALQKTARRRATAPTVVRPERAAPRVDRLEQPTARPPRPLSVGMAPPAASVLTRRQREIAGLIAGGYTNAQIAAALVLTSGTVANHVEHILNRLDFRNRAQVAVWAVEHGLVVPLPAGELAS